MWNNWLRNDGRARLTNYIIGIGVGLIIASAIAGSHHGATWPLIIIGAVLVVVSILIYLFSGKSK